MPSNTVSSRIGPRGYSLPVSAEPLPLPRPGASYTELLRRDNLPDLPRAIIALLVGLIGFTLVMPLITQLVIWLGWVWVQKKTSPYEDFQRQSLAFQHPGGMLGAHLGLGALIIVALVSLRYLCDLRPRWIWSVVGGVRWRFLWLCSGIAFLVLNTFYWVPQLGHLPVLGPQSNALAFVLIIVLTSPLQAVAEEVFFRGFLLTTLGSLTARVWIPVAGSSLIFALAHGVQNPWLLLDRVAFGILAAILVLRTGGLEAAIAAHVVNNLCAFLYAVLFSSVAQVFGTREIGWIDALHDVAAFACFAGLALLLGRRLGLDDRVPDQVAGKRISV